ncbi:MAG: hypothetical protein HN576_14410 [Bacteriovoracaceae bacterium]|jgi:hypothetical protein|nr:hypothetical protein [Bacteriovoracaceae bacterium]
MKLTLSTIVFFLTISLSKVAHGFDGTIFKFYCQQDNIEIGSTTQHTFISRVFSVESRYARYCYEANLLAEQDKFFNYLAREYDHLDLKHIPAKCFCFQSRTQAYVYYKQKLQKLRSTQKIKLYLIRTFPN